MRRRRSDDGQATVAQLARRVEELERELRARGGALPQGTPGWQEDAAPSEEPDEPVEHQWLAILEAPARRRRRLPRLPFEVLFLAGCAVAAGVADLEPLWIAAVMGAGWLLVALLEWSATIADRRRAERDAVPPPALVPVTSGRPDQAWYVPPVEQTITQGVFTDSTAVTRLRKQQAEELEATMERRPEPVADTTQA
jgi:hypothetical protein